MGDIIIKNKGDNILDKDCPDFVPLIDGTLVGDKKYCNLSFQCKQVGMAADRVTIRDGKTNKIVGTDYLCTGKYAKWEERSKDEEAE